MDIFEKIKEHKGTLGKHATWAHGYFTFPKLKGNISPHMQFNKKKQTVWSLNDYLGLANRLSVRITDALASIWYGLATPMGARMMTGNTDLHEKLEKKLSKFVGKESTFLLNYGYQGMVSIIDALTCPHDVIVYDAQAHACIIDGVRLHQGKRFVYQHNNLASLEKQLKHAYALTEKELGGILVITEGVFGMTGEQGKLKEIMALKTQYNFRLLVDDAHGFGTMGKTGAGTGEEQGVTAGIDIYFATFAKALAGIGAFVAGDKTMIDYLRYNMRSQTFAKSLPLVMVVGLLKRLSIIRENPKLRIDLWKIVRQLQTGLKEKGLDIGQTNTPITPVLINQSLHTGVASHLTKAEKEALLLARVCNLVKDLRENYQIFCSIVIYPVVPKDQIMLRLVPSAKHTAEQVNKTIEALHLVHEKLKAGFYNQPPTEQPFA